MQTCERSSRSCPSGVLETASPFSRRIRTRGIRSSRTPETKGAERRETQGLRSPRAAASRPTRRGWFARPSVEACGASLRSEARASRRSTGASFQIPGHAFCIALCLAMPSASSWREVRSDLQVEPRAARVRHACRPREPYPAPLKRCLAKAPFSEQDGSSIGLKTGPSQGIFCKWPMGKRANHEKACPVRHRVVASGLSARTVPRAPRLTITPQLHFAVC